tara:strand:+ start:71 stop:661 length:591 start_codon:yes stop_codon:yes gene_type:complete
MARKFLKLIENTISRYSNGGFLTGDVVELVSNYKSKENYKKLSDDEKNYIDSYFDSDKNYRVVNIKTSQATPAPGNSQNRGDDFTVEVALETGGGRYDMQGKVSLGADLIKKVESADGTFDSPKVPDSDRYDNKIQIDPVEPEENEEEHQTMTQQGDSLKKSNLHLAKQNTKIPSKPATPSPAVSNESYTSEYLPL